jgi:apolipoprotein N-acyltransferase
MQYAVFHFRSRSLVRGTILVLASLIAAVAASGFPDLRPTLWLLLPALVALYGTWETTRCLRQRWSFYHFGVMLLLYSDILVLALIVFLLLYPYALGLQRP